MYVVFDFGSKKIRPADFTVWRHTKIIAISNFYQMIICKDLAWMTGPTGQEEGAGGVGRAMDAHCTLHTAEGVWKKFAMALKDCKLFIRFNSFASYGELLS